MPHTAFRRRAMPPAAQPQSRPKSFPAPTAGWVSNRNLAVPPPLSAVVLENFFPGTDTIRLRGGSKQHATIGSDPCESMLNYKSGTTEKLFACGGGGIFDITAPASSTVAPAASVSGLLSNYFSHVNFSTAGGYFLYAVNGTDKPQLYNGASWAAIDSASTPNITGVTTSLLSHVNVYRNRLFFTEGGSMRVWALPVASLGGAAIQINLAGVFRNGGAVLFTATWSMDAGDGLDDKLVIVSTEGELAIYEGSDPSNPNDWGLVGRYEIPPPMGKNASTTVGGDLLILTEQGMIPVSAAITKQPAELSLAAASRNIEPDWVNDARVRRSMPWEIAKWPSRSMAIIANPVTGTEATTPPWCYIVNLEMNPVTLSVAWAKYTGWDTRCLMLHKGRVFFGSNDGTISQAEIGGSDNGAIYYARATLAFDHFNTIGAHKTIQQARGIFRTRSEFLPQLSVSTDYSVSYPSPPNVVAGAVSPGEWDVGLWDVAKWDTGSNYIAATTNWVSIGLSGYAIAPQIQISCGTEAPPSAELVVLDMTYSVGATVI